MAAMSAVANISDERSFGHGIWYELKPGWRRAGYMTHQLRAETHKECKEQLRLEVEPCDCENCTNQQRSN